MVTLKLSEANGDLLLTRDTNDIQDVERDVRMWILGVLIVEFTHTDGYDDETIAKMNEFRDALITGKITMREIEAYAEEIGWVCGASGSPNIIIE